MFGGWSIDYWGGGGVTNIFVIYLVYLGGAKFFPVGIVGGGGRNFFVHHMKM